MDNLEKKILWEENITKEKILSNINNLAKGAYLKQQENDLIIASKILERYAIKMNIIHPQFLDSMSKIKLELKIPEHLIYFFDPIKPKKETIRCNHDREA